MSLDDLRAALADLRTVYVARRIELFDAIPSTNNLLTQRARAGEPEGLAALADEQLAGKGRRGRFWSSPPGSSILCSILLRPTVLHPSQAFALTALAAVSAAEALEHATGLTIELKWPNDIQVAGRKLGGILVEIEGHSDAVLWAVIGCGININWDPTQIPELRERATSIQRELGRPADRAAIARALLEQLDSRYRQVLQGQLAELHAEWRRRLTTIGQHVDVEQSGTQLSGWAIDVDEQGALLVRDDYGYVHRLLSGDVSVRNLS